MYQSVTTHTFSGDNGHQIVCCKASAVLARHKKNFMQGCEERAGFVVEDDEKNRGRSERPQEANLSSHFCDHSSAAFSRSVYGIGPPGLSVSYCPYVCSKRRGHDLLALFVQFRGHVCAKFLWTAVFFCKTFPRLKIVRKDDTSKVCSDNHSGYTTFSRSCALQ